VKCGTSDISYWRLWVEERLEGVRLAANPLEVMRQAKGLEIVGAGGWVEDPPPHSAANDAEGGTNSVKLADGLSDEGVARGWGHDGLLTFGLLVLRPNYIVHWAKGQPGRTSAYPRPRLFRIGHGSFCRRLKRNFLSVSSGNSGSEVGHIEEIRKSIERKRPFALHLLTRGGGASAAVAGA